MCVCLCVSVCLLHQQYGTLGLTDILFEVCCCYCNYCVLRMFLGAKVLIVIALAGWLAQQLC